MKKLERITFDPAGMGGRPCMRGSRVTVRTLVGLIAAGKSREDIVIQMRTNDIAPEARCLSSTDHVLRTPLPSN